MNKKKNFLLIVVHTFSLLNLAKTNHVARRLHSDYPPHDSSAQQLAELLGSFLLRIVFIWKDYIRYRSANKDLFGTIYLFSNAVWFIVILILLCKWNLNWPCNICEIVLPRLTLTSRLAFSDFQWVVQWLPANLKISVNAKQLSEDHFGSTNAFGFSNRQGRI